MPMSLRPAFVKSPAARGRSCNWSTLRSIDTEAARSPTTPLDAAHPLWQFQLVEDYENGQSALIARIHHCIADGIALISVMMSLTDGGSNPPARRARERM